MQNPPNTLLEVSMMYAVSRCLHVIAEIGVADELEDVPRTAEELATSVGADAGAVSRALRLLSAYGIFEPSKDGWRHTPASRLLRTDHPQSMRSFVRMIGLPFNWQSFELLNDSLRTGQPAAERILPGGSWAYYAQHPEEGRIFNEAMTGKAHAQIAGILAGYDFSPFQTIADIGGGHGHLLAAIIAAYPNAKGVLFDRPHVVNEAGGISSDRLRLEGGDFFKDALPVCDAYVIMQVIHDWSDEQSIQILSAIRRAAPQHGRLLLIEAVLPDDLNPSWTKMLDIFMMALFGGKERTRAEFENLLTASGFHLESVTEVGLGISVLQASVV